MIMNFHLMHVFSLNMLSWSKISHLLLFMMISSDPDEIL